MSKDKEMPLIEHLRELKDRVKVVMISFVVALIFWLAFPADLTEIIRNPEFYEPMVTLVLKRIVQDLAGARIEIIGCSMTSPFEIFFLAAAFLALATIMPVIGYETYAYVDPALYPHERRLIYGFTLAFVALFAVGGVFGYFVAAPLIMRAMVFFFELAGVIPTVCAMDFYSLVFTTVLLIGVVFTSPVVLVLLVRFGIISTDLISRNRLYVYGILYILVAIITPDGWLVGNAVLFLPLVALIESSLFIAKRVERNRLKSMIVGYCKFCGNGLRENEIFCSKCGRAQE
ncbi:sec-independent protein translocase protein TatC [Candidatus Caldarchaeum subterraneum]|uniref:Sec-independent protein translocase protein TatC n=1 Tax=Caldiarchaeum subterraneum TaxID=311458 RepID=E6N5D1_CALS0|nr:sec-independent protein translocase protein TatC [Candidatus Caldarchaeum subterraneum]BAJ50316.1 sec-independent protein translocase protein TatC [Candidatus Caldarchaeum subterraneum]